MAGSDSSIKAGELRHYGTILAQNNTPDASGNTVAYLPVPSLTNFQCGIDPKAARALIRNGQTTSQTTIPIQMRYVDGILPNMQFQWVRGPAWASTTQTYVIEGIENVEERNRKLILTCVALSQNT
jgi:head-tail adaptor